VVDGLAFGEGPRWHDGHLWLSDMHAHQVLRIGETGAEVVAAHSGPLSGLGWLPDGRLLVVAMDGWVLRLDQPGHDLVVHADLRAFAPHEINDMIVHRRGWAWVGQFGYDFRSGATPRGSALLRVDPDGSVSEAAPDLLIANGMAITPAGDELIVAESRGRCLTSFAIGSDGALSDRKVFADVGEASPDGICLDAEGAVWVACPRQGSFIRVRRGGEVTDRIELPAGRSAIACVLGGSDRAWLYLLSAVTLGEAEASQAARSASVHKVRVAVSGAGRP